MDVDKSPSHESETDFVLPSRLVSRKKRSKRSDKSTKVAGSPAQAAQQRSKLKLRLNLQPKKQALQSSDTLSEPDSIDELLRSPLESLIERKRTKRLQISKKEASDKEEGHWGHIEEPKVRRTLMRQDNFGNYVPVTPEDERRQKVRWTQKVRQQGQGDWLGDLVRFLQFYCYSGLVESIFFVSIGFKGKGRRKEPKRWWSGWSCAKWQII